MDVDWISIKESEAKGLPDDLEDDSFQGRMSFLKVVFFFFFLLTQNCACI